MVPERPWREYDARVKTTVKKAQDALVGWALGMPGAWKDTPWGETVAKVGKKVFVFFGHPDYAEGNLVFSVKIPATRGEAMSLGFAEPTGYGLGRSGWISFKIPPAKIPDLDLLKAWIEESYRNVAPATLVRKLDASSGEAGARTPGKRTRAASRGGTKPRRTRKAKK